MKKLVDAIIDEVLVRLGFEPARWPQGSIQRQACQAIIELRIKGWLNSELDIVSASEFRQSMDSDLTQNGYLTRLSQKRPAPYRDDTYKSE